MTLRTRRSARRHAPISCEVVRDAGFVLLGRKILDLSDSGMRVSFVDPEMGSMTPIGSKLWVSFRAGHVGLWFDFEAEVVRISLGRRPGDDQASFGVRFVTRWDAGQACAPALARLLLRGGLSRLKPVQATPALRGRRRYAAPRIVDVDAKPTAEALLRANFP